MISGDLLLQDPVFSGGSAVGANLPAQDVAIAVTVTNEPGAFDATTGSYPNTADQLWREIALKVVPDNSPPIKKGRAWPPHSGSGPFAVFWRPDDNS
ncbi:MAG: hypothetical protein ABWZ02_09020 [Nakamurella sp.]